MMCIFADTPGGAQLLLGILNYQTLNLYLCVYFLTDEDLIPELVKQFTMDCERPYYVW